jgi:exopolysaccharide biosynthesis polyprenyl glycosylphosphotransferase
MTAPERVAAEGSGAGEIAVAPDLVERASREGLLPREAAAPWQGTIASAHGRRDWILRRALAVADMAGILCALVVAFTVAGVHDDAQALWALPLLPGWVALFALYRGYERDVKRISQSGLDDLPWLFHALVIGSLLMWLYFRLLPVHRLVFEEVLVFGLIGLLLVPAFRFVVRRGITRFMGPERVLLVGVAPVTEPLIRKMRTHPEYAVEPVGLVTNGADSSQAQDLAIVADLSMASITDAADRLNVQRLIVAAQEVPDQLMIDLLQECGRRHMKLSVLPRHVSTMGPSVEVDDIEGVTVFGLNPLVLARSSRGLKRIVDVLGASLACLDFAPVMALIALAIKLDSRGPVLFRQTRMGRRGEPFMLPKFRTMQLGAESRVDELRAQSEDPHWLKLEQDPRITRVGRILRRTSLDELPQLWMVLTGKMSLVGPRPLIKTEDELVASWARMRLDLAPGITGLWQVLGRTDIPFEEMVKLDYAYVTNWSLWLDIKLLLRTLPVVLLRRGAN